MNKRMLIVKILWGSLLISICILAGINFLLNPEDTTSNVDAISFNDPQTLIFAIAAVGAGVMSFVLFNILRNNLLKNTPDRADFISSLKEARSDNGQPIYSQKDIEYISSLDDARLRMFYVQSKMFTANILRWALTEAVAIFGFLLSRITFNKLIAAPFFVAAIALMLISFPKSEIEAKMR